MCESVHACAGIPGPSPCACALLFKLRMIYAFQDPVVQVIAKIIAKP